MCLILHPVIYELGGSLVRGTMGRSAKHDPFRDHFLLFFFEAIMVMIRRFLLTGIGTPTVSTIAIVLTGVEETFFRATLVSRDEWVRTTFFGGKELTAEQRANRNKVWACSINASMM